MCPLEEVLMDVSYQAVHTEAIMIPVYRCDSPLTFVLCRPSSTLPGFVVRVVRTSGPLPPMLIRPTDDSGLACVFE